MYSPVKGARVSSRYMGGFRKTGGHSGIDFAAPSGSRIYAFAGGTVISTGWGGAYGNLTKVRHDDGSVGYYAHQSRFAVKPGQRIQQGSLIGFVGSTGNSTGPHAHVEVRVDGNPVDPTPWLSGQGVPHGHESPSGVMSGRVTHGPDIVQFTDPNDTLAMLEQQSMGVPGSDLAGGFATPALDAAGGRTSGTPEIATSLGREAALIRQSQMLGQMAAYQTSMMEAAGQQAPTAVSQGSHAHGGGAAGDLDKLIAAIRGEESGGNYGARNKDSGALGAYQVMPANIASWSKAALGYSITPEIFLRNPGLQDRIARHRLGQYFQKYGASGAALAWYAGEGALRYSNSTRNRSQGSYPSMNSYVQNILRRAGL